MIAFGILSVLSITTFELDCQHITTHYKYDFSSILFSTQSGGRLAIKNCNIDCNNVATAITNYKEVYLYNVTFHAAGGGDAVCPTFCNINSLSDNYYLTSLAISRTPVSMYNVLGALKALERLDVSDNPGHIWYDNCAYTVVSETDITSLTALRVLYMRDWTGTISYVPHSVVQTMGNQLTTFVG